MVEERVLEPPAMVAGHVRKKKRQGGKERKKGDGLRPIFCPKLKGGLGLCQAHFLMSKFLTWGPSHLMFSSKSYK